MKLTLLVWWALLWRFALLLILVALWVAVRGDLIFFGVDPETAIRWRPTIYWWTFAVVIFGVSAASLRFFVGMVWGQRMKLEDPNWRAIAHGVALCSFVLGLLNLVVWKFGSTAAWVDFKTFVLLPLFAVFLGFLSTWVVRSGEPA